MHHHTCAGLCLAALLQRVVSAVQAAAHEPNDRVDTRFAYAGEGTH